MKKESSFIIQRTKPGFTIYRFLGLILGIILFYALNQYLGISIMFFSSMMALTAAGREIDTAGCRTRDFRSLGNLYFGKWHTLPKIEYIAVVRMIQGKKSFHASSVSIIQVPSNDYVYQLNFVVNAQKKEVIKLYEGEAQPAIAQAIRLGEMMDLKVLDFSTPQHKWIR